MWIWMKNIKIHDIGIQKKITKDQYVRYTCVMNLRKNGQHCCAALNRLPLLRSFSLWGRTCSTYRNRRIKGSNCQRLCVFRKAVMAARGRTIGTCFRSAKSANLLYFIDSCMHRALFALVAAERDSDTSQDARDEAGSGDGAAGGCSQGCRKALPVVSLASYTERSSNPSVFVAVCARSFYLDSSWSSTKSTRLQWWRAMNRIGDRRCYDINHT